MQEAVRRDRVDAEHRQLQRVAVSVDQDGIAFVEDRLLAPGGLLERRNDEHPLAYTSFGALDASDLMG